MQNWSRRAMLLGGASYLLAACTFGLAGGPAGGLAGSLPYSVGVHDQGDQVTIRQSSDMQGGGYGAVYVATVRSARGIGDATVAWWGSVSPHQLVFQLELSGLEHFSLIWADQTVNVSVNSVDRLADPSAELVVLESVQTRGGSERMIDPASPNWIDVALLPDGRGYYLIAPQTFQAAWPGLWAIRWIDFYR